MAEAHPHSRGRRCCCCLFGVIWKLLVAIIVLIVLFIVITLLVIQPRDFRFSVNEAKLTKFNYTTNTNTIHYNLVLNFTARNPNKKLTIYYDEVEGHVSYEGTRFASTDVITHLNSFHQYTKSTNPMSGVFSGERVVVFDRDQVSNFERDEKNGIFHIDVKLYFKMRFGLSDAPGGYNKGNIKCGLEVPLSSNGTKVMNEFEPTTCSVKF